MQTTRPIPDPLKEKKPSIWPFFVLGLLMIALFVGLNQWLVSGPATDTEPEEAARNELRIKNLAELRAENEKQLATYAWVDRNKGTVQIPIDQAMALVVPQLNSGAPRPAYPVVVPAPPASPDAVPAAAPDAAPAAAPDAAPAAAPATPPASTPAAPLP